MGITLKKLDDQVMVITGASSGIGLTTARMAASRGARLVLAARSEGALAQLTREIKRAGGQAVYVVADVSNQADVQRIARTALDEYGWFDTWVNNASAGIYGTLEQTPIEDMRALFETNFWGVVYGSLEAVKHLKVKGGALINIGSVESDRVVRLQGVYATSKHAVKGWTDALRLDLEAEDAPVSVTLIKPSAINTPFPMNGKNFLDKAPTLPPPVYAPETVARAILHCAQTPTRDLIVGAGGKQLSMLGYYAPRLTDLVMQTATFGRTQTHERPARPREQNALDRPSDRLQERGDYEGHVFETSLYTQATMHPVRATALALGAAGVIVAWLRGRR
jgi:short-subunit dehydrogenase